MRVYKKLLVPLDTSEFAECVLDHVRGMVAAYAIPEVVLLTVTDSEYQPYAGHLDLEVVRAARERDAKVTLDYLEKVKEALGLSDSMVTTVMHSGMPEVEILQYIEKNGIDVVIMSTQGRSGAAKWLLGSVSERVIRFSPVPVLMVPALACRLES
jgi:nucleotide-binding universal stress UspA family protein